VILAGTQSAVETLLMIIASVLEQADASEPFAKQAVVLFDELIKSDDILLKPDVLANVKAFVVLITLASTSDPSATEALAKTELKLAKPTQRGLPEVNFAFDLSNPFARTNGNHVHNLRVALISFIRLFFLYKCLPMLRLQPPLRAPRDPDSPRVSLLPRRSPSPSCFLNCAPMRRRARTTLYEEAFLFI